MTSDKSESAQRPEQVFFEDPAVDRLMGVVLALATEHYVLLDRVHVLERQLSAAGVVPGAAGQAAEHADAGALAEALFRPLLGVQQSRGAAGRFSLARAERREENPQ
jgi:hypothetical protein